MKSHTITLSVLAIAILVLAVVILMKPINSALGGAFTGSASHLQAATTATVGNQAVPARTLFAAKADDSCKARVITTNFTGINISFGDVAGLGSTTISSNVGHWQPASTTVAYDGEIYGCGLWTGFAAATTTVTVSEF